VFNNALVLAKLLVLILFCLLGVLHVQWVNFTPFDPASLGVLSGASYIFFAYGGFARVAVVAEEVRDPERNVPRAILLSLAISTVFYVAIGLVAVGLVGASRLSASRSPLTEAIRATGSQAAVSAVSAGGMLATASVLLTSVLGVSRVAYAMARRGDLPKVFGRLQPQRDTPSYAVWTTGAVMAAGACWWCSCSPRLGPGSLASRGLREVGSTTRRRAGRVLGLRGWAQTPDRMAVGLGVTELAVHEPALHIRRLSLAYLSHLFWDGRV
jgi:amino acid transporter